MSGQPPLVPLHTVPSPIEQEHIHQALDASQTAMSAIQTVTSVASWTLTIIGIAIALLALWGVTAIIMQARKSAERIANERFDAYIKSDEFKEMVKERISKSVDERWGNAFVVSRLSEDKKPAGEASPFPAATDLGETK